MTEPAVAIVRAAALRNNLKRAQALAPRCRVLAVIKSNAYGHGLIQTARALAGADGFAVARLPAAVQLRDAGIAAPVVVLGGPLTGSDLEIARDRNLDVLVHSTEQVEMLEALPAGSPVAVWLKVDSGMGRLGIDPSQVTAVAARLHNAAAVHEPVRLLTHLACADEPDNSTTAEQLERFGRAIGAWPGDVSIANSAGILRWPQTLGCGAQLSYGGENWVRPGLMLYGVSPLPGCTAETLGLQPAMSFETRLVAIRQLPAGSPVGYGGTWVASRDSVIGVAAAGYGDGYPWQVPTGTPVIVNAIPAPVVGRVSMDMITVDLTELPGAKVGDRVQLWGGAMRVEDIAQRAGTIPYELLTGVSERVQRQMDWGS